MRKTRIYIEKKAEEYGFVLNSQARSLKTSKTNTIGVLFPLNFDSLSKNLMFTHIFDQLQRELSRRSYDIMIVYDHDPEMKSNTFERVIPQRQARWSDQLQAAALAARN